MLPIKIFAGLAIFISMYLVFSLSQKSDVILALLDGQISLEIPTRMRLLGTKKVAGTNKNKRSARLNVFRID